MRRLAQIFGLLPSRTFFKMSLTWGLDLSQVEKRGQAMRPKRFRLVPILILAGMVNWAVSQIPPPEAIPGHYELIFKNGKTERGEVLSSDGSSFRFRTLDGSSFRLRWSLIKETKKLSPAAGLLIQAREKADGGQFAEATDLLKEAKRVDPALDLDAEVDRYEQASKKNENQRLAEERKTLRERIDQLADKYLYTDAFTILSRELEKYPDDVYLLERSVEIEVRRHRRDGGILAEFKPTHLGALRRSHPNSIVVKSFDQMKEMERARRQATQQLQKELAEHQRGVRTANPLQNRLAGRQNGVQSARLSRENDELRSPSTRSGSFFFEVRDYMLSKTEAQWKAYARKLAGREIEWSGWVEDVNEKFFGGYELWIDMDPPSALLSVTDIKFDIPDRLALSLEKDQRVRFRGRIKRASNILGSIYISLDDAHVM